VVEAAFILPLFFLFVFALIEFGHARMVGHLLNSACRNGARYGATEGATTANVRNQVRQILASAIDPDQVVLLVKDASDYDNSGNLPETSAEFEALPDVEISGATPRQLFLVRATVQYNDISLLSLPFMNGVEITGQSFTRHE
jgi:Flp pilus assembly protein TadG